RLVERSLVDRGEDDGADDLAADHERLGNGTPDPGRHEELAELGIRRRLRPPGLDVERDHRAARGDRPTAAACRVSDRWMVPERLDERLETLVAGAERHPPDRALRV